MNGVLKKVLIILFIVFILLAVLSLFNVASNNHNNSVLQNPLINYDNYLGKQVIIYGNYQLSPVLCRAQNDCDYNVVFNDKKGIFPNLSVYKNEIPVTCHDEYSVEPRKFLHTVCGITYIDSSINREKFEQMSIDFSTVQNYTFTVQKNQTEYYLDIS